ncbi:hypothetical protein HPB52_003201 [Rhipicephalus sanguineus]|uniref:Tnf receptor-associated factor n=1 Tax=Rhipicephalus sanguineus TaxID=34632 RepID=A0A9D4PNG9_RHISA|nr:hypothetical protein HPB52_003201 [Rhipicephalus sanguineus]
MASPSPHLETAYTLFDFGNDIDWRRTLFLEPLPPHRFCTYCGRVCARMMLLPCCHILCASCYAQCQRANSACVLDGQVFRNFDVAVTTFTNDALALRRIRCWNAESGCEIEGLVFTVLEHYRKECPYHAVTCSRCNRVVSHKDMVAHLASGCSAETSLEHFLEQKKQAALRSIRESLIQVGRQASSASCLLNGKNIQSTPKFDASFARGDSVSPRCVEENVDKGRHAVINRPILATNSTSENPNQRYNCQGGQLATTTRFEKMALAGGGGRDAATRVNPKCLEAPQYCDRWKEVMDELLQTRAPIKPVVSEKVECRPRQTNEKQTATEAGNVDWPEISSECASTLPWIEWVDGNLRVTMASPMTAKSPKVMRAEAKARALRESYVPLKAESRESIGYKSEEDEFYAYDSSEDDAYVPVHCEEQVHAENNASGVLRALSLEEHSRPSSDYVYCRTSKLEDTPPAPVETASRKRSDHGERMSALFERLDATDDSLRLIVAGIEDVKTLLESLVHNDLVSISTTCESPAARMGTFCKNEFDKAAKETTTAAREAEDSEESDASTQEYVPKNCIKLMNIGNAALRERLGTSEPLQWFLDSWSELKEKATATGKATHYFSGTNAAFFGYFIVPGVLLKNTSGTLRLHFSFFVRRGIYDEFLQWPMEKHLTLTTIHPTEKGKARMLSVNTNRCKNESSSRTGDESRDPVVSRKSIGADYFDMNGYAAGDRLLLIFEVM